MIRYYLAALIISIFLSACYHSEDTIDIKCGDSGIGLQFIGYTPTDIDTFIVRKYRSNNNYSTLIDTSFVDISRWKKTVHGDTTETFSGNYSSQITNSYDWEIFIPAKSRTYRFSEIVFEKRISKCPLAVDCMCYNNVTSIKLDNQPYPLPKQTTPGFYFVSLKN